MNRNPHDKFEHSLIKFYRRVLDQIQAGGNIFNDRGRLESYVIIARLKSEFQRKLDEETSDQ